MDIGKALKKAEKFVFDNSPTIMTGLGVAGTLTTAYLAGIAGFKASSIVEEIEREARTSTGDSEYLLSRETILKETWKLYIPVGVSVSFTIFAVVASNRIGTRRAAAMAAAYTIAERGFGEYTEKVIEKFGEKGEREIRDELAQDALTKHPASKTIVLDTGGGDDLCYDKFNGRYFWSSMEMMKQAQNRLNHKVINSFYASLNDFYSFLGLDDCYFGEEVGWNSDNLMELSFTTGKDDQDRPCHVMHFLVVPIRDYYKAH